MRTNPLNELKRQLAKLESDCRDFLKASQKETELLNQTRVIPAVTPPTSPNSVDPTPATEQEQKRWRFTTGENGQIPPAIALKAATDANLLAAIQEEIEQRIAEEKG